MDGTRSYPSAPSQPSRQAAHRRPPSRPSQRQGDQQPQQSQQSQRGFVDRWDGGRQLADRLEHLGLERPLVLGLPRGGVPVGAVVADRLQAPLDVFVARKIGAPTNPELGVGSIAEGTNEVLVTEFAHQWVPTLDEMDALVLREQAELRRRVDLYRRGRPPLPVLGRDVVVVDDGLATGVTAEAALLSVRRWEPRRLILAVPVASLDTRQRLGPVADDIVCVLITDDLRAVGAWYDDFDPTTDDDVVDILRRFHPPRVEGMGDPAPAPAPASAPEPTPGRPG
jgi:predicted phosphoribosyltransferase